MRDFLPFSVLIILFSCGIKEEGSVQASNSYVLEKVDSFQVAHLTHVRIMDYSPDEDVYLAFSEGDDNFMEVDANGNILKTVNRKGEGPDTFGARNPVGFSFGPNGERMVQTSFQLISYDKDYHQTHKSAIRNPLPVRANVPLVRNQYYLMDGDEHYLVGPTTYLSSHALIYNELGRDTLQNFLVLNHRSGDIKSAVPYEPESIYKQTEHVYYNLMGKSFFIEGDELFVSQHLGKAIQVYDLKDEFKLTREIPINHSDWVKASPMPLGTDPSDEKIKTITHTAGRNLSLIPVNEEIFLLRYYQGISEGAYEALHTEENPYSIKKAKDRNKLLIFKNGKQLNGELAMPKGDILFALPGNRLLVLEEANEEVEEEVTRYAIYELREN